MTARPARRARTVDEVASEIERGDVRGLARALSWAEDVDPRGARVLSRVYSRAGRARILGVTGSPGAGKSTLVDRLAASLAESGRKVAVIAVDPSSAYSGGAILGDRIRMKRATEVPGVFIRSMATRGHLGGLARATEDAVDLCDAFGFDDVILETVGVGQDEIEVVQVAHVNLVVLVPFMGDDVQAIKAGIMEIADAFVINKADRDGVDRLEAHLRMMLHLAEPPEGESLPDVPIVRTVATRGDGLDDVLTTIDELWRAGNAEDRARRRAERVRTRLAHLLRDRLLEDFLGAQPGALDEAARRVVGREEDPYAATDRLLAAAPSAASPPTPTVDHVGVAVESIEEALPFWRDVVGLPQAEIEEVASEKVRVALLPAGQARLELLEATSEDSAIARFLAKRGPGLQQLCLEVPDLDGALRRLREAGCRILGEAPRLGAGGRSVAFVHPKDASGVLLELVQSASGAEAERGGSA